MVFNYIVSDPDILNGKPRISGTRIGVGLILEWIANGSSIEQITETFPQLSAEAVKEAIRYAAELSNNDLYVALRIAS
jgi:uncharacterized protein (DUF433 family)